MGKYEIIKFTLKNKLDYYIIESVYQNAFIKEQKKVTLILLTLGFLKD